MANFYGTDINDTTFGGTFDNIYGGDGLDFLAGTPAANQIYGGQGNDALLGAQYLTFAGTGTSADPIRDLTFGPSGNDYLEGGTGDDIVYGADGDDTIYGGDGNESGNVAFTFPTIVAGGLFGGEGNDFIDGGNGNDLLDGATGNDILLGGLGNDTLNGGADFDFLDGGNGSDLLDGGVGGDVISGGHDSDTLNGGSDNDLLYGDVGNDTLRGEAGSDSIDGGAGRDVLTGGLNRDFLTGSSGLDLFDFNAVNETGRTTSTRDQILDFHRRQDDIDLRTIDANEDRVGNNAFRFIGSDAFSDRAGELRIRGSGNNVIVQGDVDGDGRSDFEIFVRDVEILSRSDFLL